MHGIEDKELSRLIDAASPSAQNLANLALGAAFGSAPAIINTGVALAKEALPAATDLVGCAVALVFLGIGATASLGARQQARRLRADIEDIRSRPVFEIERYVEPPAASQAPQARPR